jgi:hypothetical protein
MNCNFHIPYHSFLYIIYHHLKYYIIFPLTFCLFSS